MSANIKNEDSLIENIKSKYILANTIKTNKLNSKLSKSINNVISDKSFIGYNENDYDNVENLCNIDNINLFVKNKSQFCDDIISNNNLIVKKKTIIGATDDTDVEQNNKIYNEKTNLTVCGDSAFYGDSSIYGSECIKNNLTVNNKSYFDSDITLNNSLTLKKEIIENVFIHSNTISPEHYNLLLNNILSSIQNNNINNFSLLKFSHKKNININSGLFSASKKFVLSKKNINAFLLVYIIYSNTKIIAVKPILDTFVIIDSKENIIKISNITPEQTNVVYESENNTDDKSENNTSLFSSTINLLKNNKITNLFKKMTDDDNNDETNDNVNT